MVGFPPSQVRVVATRTHGRFAVVLMETNDGPPFEPYQVVCMREDDGWIEGPGINGPGWTMTDEGWGVVTHWDIDMATGRILVTTPPEGFPADPPEDVLFCIWDVPEDEIPDWPEHPTPPGWADGPGFIDLIE
jgi:hypothetical protein